MNRIVKTYKLIEPLKIGDGELTELQFIEPKARQMRSLTESADYGKFIDIACSLTLRKPGSLDNLSKDDTHNVVDITVAILKPGS